MPSSPPRPRRNSSASATSLPQETRDPAVETRQAYLRPDSYRASQQLGRRLLDQGSAGIVYPSVRHAGGSCVACFRPALVGNVCDGARVTFTFPDAFHAPKVKVSR